jgi:hypothetical protein
VPPEPTTLGAAGTALVIRVVALLRGWDAPLPPRLPRER